MQVSIACPTCNALGKIDIPQTIIENHSRGLVSINVPSEYICKHNFQFFLDRNGSVRGYQRIDFQVFDNKVQQAEEKKQIYTKFPCRLCGQEMVFNILDKGSYLSKRDHERYFGMQLATYQVAHVLGSEMHVNTVIVDETGNFQGHVESYPIPLSEFLANGVVPEYEKKLRIMPEDAIPLTDHKFLEIFFELDYETQQVIVLVCPKALNIVEIAKLCIEKIKESKKIYQSISESLLINIADKKFRIWTSGNQILVTNSISDNSLALFDKIAKKMLEIPVDGLVSRNEQLKTAIRFLEKPNLSEKEIPTFFRFIQDDRLSSKIKVKYPENVPRILSKLNQEFGLETTVLQPFLKGEKSLSEVLGQETITRASELFEVVDFIDRRKLFD